jgi:hypothetical protein
MADEGKAFALKLEDLSKAVDQAVGDVLQRHQLQAGAGLAFGPNTLIGRQLMGKVADVGAIQQAAADVTAEVQKSIGGSGKLSPAAFIGPGHIIVGFVPENMFPNV